MKRQPKKDDNDKSRFDLIPADILIQFADVYTMGAKKYGARNMEGGMRWGRIFAAMMRHSWKWWGGEEYDREDGQHHLMAVAWCAFTLLFYAKRNVGEDDRPISEREER